MGTAPTKITPKMLEEAVRSMNLATTMNECLWVGDRHHRTLYVNPVFEEISGYKLEECVNKNCIAFFDEKSKKIIEEHHKLREAGKSSQYEATLLTKNGEKVPLLISGSPTNDGGTIGIFTNLTKIKELEQQELLSSQIIKNSAEAIVVLDKNRMVRMWNTGAARLFGYKEKDMLGKSINQIIPESEIEANTLLRQEVDVKKYVNNVEAQRQTKDGNLVDVSITIRKVTDEDDQFIGYLVIYQDITERKQINNELQKRFEAIQDAYKELGLQKRQFDYISEIVDIAVSSAGLEPLEKMIISAACMLTKCDATTLRLYSPETDSLQLKATLGVNTKWLAKSKVPLKGSLAQEAFVNKRAIIINDIANSQKHKSTNLIKAHGFKTLILIPLTVTDQLVGSLSLYSTDPGKFRTIETDFLEQFGKQCSLALFAKTCQN